MSESVAQRPVAPARAPIHLWIVGVLALLWNAYGAFDYVATQIQWEPYMGQFPQEALDYFYGFPAWVTACWALGVWGGLAGAVGLLLRRRWAVWMFAASLLGLLGTTTYSYLLSEGAAIMGSAGTIFTIVIWIIQIALLVYALRLEKNGVLT